MKWDKYTIETTTEAEDYISCTLARTNYAIYTSINPSCKIIRGESPVTLLKAIRNEQEIDGIHHAMQRDGVISAETGRRGAAQFLQF